MSDPRPVEIPLHRHRLPCGVSAIIDASDAPLIAGRRWSLFVPQRSRTRYARCGSVYLHALIMGDPPSDDVEIGHRDGDGLNNRRSNLNWITHRENVIAAQEMYPTKASRVHTVRMRGKLYFYDRTTRAKLTAEEAAERIANPTYKSGVTDAVTDR